MNRPQEVTLSPPEGEERIEHERWTDDNRRVVVQVLRISFWVLFALQDAKLSLTRLRTLLFGEPTPRRRVPSSHDSSDTASPESSEHGDSASGLATGNVDGPPRPARGHRPRQGRVGAVSNEGTERVACRHEARRVGEVCPVCGQGRLYALPPGVEMRLDGDALLSAIRDEVEKLRCAACGEVFTAALPDGTGAE
jgi:transposase